MISSLCRSSEIFTKVKSKSSQCTPILKCNISDFTVHKLIQILLCMYAEKIKKWEEIRSFISYWVEICQGRQIKKYVSHPTSTCFCGTFDLSHSSFSSLFCICLTNLGYRVKFYFVYTILSQRFFFTPKFRFISKMWANEDEYWRMLPLVLSNLDRNSNLWSIFSLVWWQISLPYFWILGPGTFSSKYI